MESSSIMRMIKMLPVDPQSQILFPALHWWGQDPLSFTGALDGFNLSWVIGNKVSASCKPCSLITMLRPKLCKHKSQLVSPHTEDWPDSAFTGFERVMRSGEKCAQQREKMQEDAAISQISSHELKVSHAVVHTNLVHARVPTLCSFPGPWGARWGGEWGKLFVQKREARSPNGSCCQDGGLDFRNI